MSQPFNRYARTTPGPWRPQGPPFYIVDQGHRLGFDWKVTEHPRVKDNRQLQRIAGLTAEVCSNYFQPRHHDGAFSDHQLACARDTLARCEVEIEKTHCIAAASAAMVDEAWRAFGLEPPLRSYGIVDTTEVGNHLVAMQAEIRRLTDEIQVQASAPVPPDNTDELAALRAEVVRLTAENEALAERLTAPPSHPRKGHGRGGD